MIRGYFLIHLWICVRGMFDKNFSIFDNKFIGKVKKKIIAGKIILDTFHLFKALKSNVQIVTSRKLVSAKMFAGSSLEYLLELILYLV